MKNEYRKTTLDNGLRVLSLPAEGRAGVAIGVWIDAGSRDDPSGREGMAHLTEHLMFKGTEKRTALQISRELERVGGSGDAYTSREETCYYAYLPGEHLPLALDIIGDMIAHSKFEGEVFQREIRVVLEEMAEIDDSTQETAHEQFPKMLFGDHPLGAAIIGLPHTVGVITPDEIKGFLRENYTSNNTVVAAAGNVDHDTLLALSNRFIKLPKSAGNSGRVPPEAIPMNKMRFLHRESSQVNIVLGGRTFAFEDMRRYPLAVLNKVLGGGASSLLFQRIREDYGIGYNVHSFIEYYHDAGLWGVFAAVERKNVTVFFRLLKEILNDLSEKGIEEETLNNIVSGLSGRLRLQKDAISAPLNRLAENELQLGRYIPVEESLGNLRKVTVEEIRKLARKLFDPSTISGVAVGPVDNKYCPDWLTPGREASI